MTCSSCSDHAPLCDACRRQRLSWHLGTASVRGWRWAADVRASGWRGRWRTYDESPRVRELAAARVTELAGGDQELLEQLARACAAAALEEWQHPAARAGGVSFLPGHGPMELRQMSEAERDRARREAHERVMQPRVLPASSWAPRGRRLPLRRAPAEQPADVSEPGAVGGGDRAPAGRPPRSG